MTATKTKDESKPSPAAQSSSELAGPVVELGRQAVALRAQLEGAEAEATAAAASDDTYAEARKRADDLRDQLAEKEQRLDHLSRLYSQAFCAEQADFLRRLDARRAELEQKARAADVSRRRKRAEAEARLKAEFEALDEEVAVATSDDYDCRQDREKALQGYPEWAVIKLRDLNRRRLDAMSNGVPRHIERRISELRHRLSESESELRNCLVARGMKSSTSAADVMKMVAAAEAYAANQGTDDAPQSGNGPDKARKMPPPDVHPSAAHLARRIAGELEKIKQAESELAAVKAELASIDDDIAAVNKAVGELPHVQL
jgi:hypothetical protein